MERRDQRDGPVPHPAPPCLASPPPRSGVVHQGEFSDLEDHSFTGDYKDGAPHSGNGTWKSDGGEDQERSGGGTLEGPFAAFALER